MSADIKPTIFEHEHPEPNTPGSALLIFVIMSGLTIMALMIGFMELGAFKVWASLTVACVQAVVLTLFFMDLRHADKLTWLIASAAIFWTFLLFLFTLTDYLTRHYYAY